MAIVILNAILGFVQEFKAEKAIEALQKMLSPKCRVVRDGKESEMDASELVPGDIVLLEIGDRVPGDLRLIEAVNLKVDESALTGESVSVNKAVKSVPAEAPLAERRDMVWMGTGVTNGYAKGVVVATGMDTEFGKIAKLTSEVKPAGGRHDNARTWSQGDGTPKRSSKKIAGGRKPRQRQRYLHRQDWR